MFDNKWFVQRNSWQLWPLNSTKLGSRYKKTNANKILPAFRKPGFPGTGFNCFSPNRFTCWGSLLEKNGLDTLLGALGLVGRGFGPAGRAGLGWAWGLAVLGALAGLGVVLGVLWVGRGVWLCWTRWLGWAWGLAVLGPLGWAWCWACWACWLGWAWCWAWGLAVLGALAGLGVVLGVGFGRASWVGRGVGRGFGRAGRAGWVGRGVGRAGRAGWVGRGVGCAGRAGWVGRAVGRGVWLCLARWLGWAWCWAPGLAVLGALAVQKYTFQVQKYTLEVHKYTFTVQKYTLEVQKYTLEVQKLYFQSTQVYSRSTKVYFQGTKVDFQITQSIFTSTQIYF